MTSVPQLMKSVPRVVPDTNVLVSGLIAPSGPPGLVVEAILRGVVTAVSTRALHEEFLRVLSSDKIRRRYHVSAADLVLLTRVELVVPAPVAVDLRDPEDLWLLESAVGGHAAAIISGDRDLHTEEVTEAMDAFGIQVLRPTEFEDWLIHPPQNPSGR